MSVTSKIVPPKQDTLKESFYGMRRADTAWLADWTLKLTLRAAEGTFSPTARAEGSRPSWGAQPSQRLPGQQHCRLALLQETPELTIPAVPALHAINTSLLCHNRGSWAAENTAWFAGTAGSQLGQHRGPKYRFQNDHSAVLPTGSSRSWVVFGHTGQGGCSILPPAVANATETSL